MEIRSILSIYDLKDNISNNQSEDSFLDNLRHEQKKYEKDDYRKVKKIWLELVKKRDGLAKYLVYKYWVFTRIPVYILHRVKKVDNPRLFYDSKVFYLSYKKLSYPLIKSNGNLFNDTALNIYENINNYVDVSELLEDKKSKTVLLEILKCRLTRNIDCILKVYDDESLQYFDDTIIGKINDEVFVDVGGYIGDTTECFLDKYDNIKKVYIYEPNTENLKVAKKKLKEHSKSNISIDFRDAGASNIETESKLSKKGSGSRIVDSETCDCSDNTEIIKLVKLDEDIKESITFIKMDIEGEEAKALEGARIHIQNENPKLAISVYHNLDDLWQLPLQINRYSSNYKMFLRHYCNYNLSETVLYCIPK